MTLTDDEVDVDDVGVSDDAEEPVVLLAYCCSPFSSSESSARPAAEGSVAPGAPELAEDPLAELEVELVLDVELAEAASIGGGSPPP